MTDERLLLGFLVLIGIGVSFALTIFLFGFVVLLGLLLALVGLSLWLGGRSRHTVSSVLLLAGVTLTGPLVYIGLAVLHS